MPGEPAAASAPAAGGPAPAEGGAGGGQATNGVVAGGGVSQDSVPAEGSAPVADGALAASGPAPAGGSAPASGSAPAGGSAPASGSAPAARTGRNLPAAIGVGAGLGGLAILTLFTVKVTFLVYMTVMVAIALWELSRAVAGQGIRLPVVPVAAGGFTAVALAYWRGERPMIACLALTVFAILAWRLRGGAAGYLRDVTGGVFALSYLPLMACFVSLMLAVPDGPQRTLMFLILAVCSDVGGYAAGILLGHHLMAPAISPKKTWEGFGGSAFACLLGGAITMTTLLGGAVWQGILVGAAVLAAATLGDLAESMMKRDLGIKDMGSLLPGHGGVLDRLDSLLLTAPVVWLLLLVFIPGLHQR